MKLLFICGTLEAGKNGVGDYTRLLAQELAARGCEVTVIALNDRFIKSKYCHDRLLGVERVRLPEGWPARKRFTLAQQVIADSAPDWISLQFVPYAYHVKGFPVALGDGLKRIGGLARWHVMFHELWAGMEQGAPLKLRVTARLQKAIIRRMLRALKPCLIHSQSQVYVNQLQKMGVGARQLEIFGNIPVIQRPPRGGGDRQIGRPPRIVVFGGICPGVEIEPFSKELAQVCSAYGGGKVTFVGRNGEELPRWKKAFSSSGLAVEILGELSEEEVSKVLAESDAGIGSAPLRLVEKSGSIAALRDHGLPVFCVSKPWRERVDAVDFQSIGGIMDYQKGSLSQYGEFMLRRSMPEHTLSKVADRFENEIRLAQ